MRRDSIFYQIFQQQSILLFDLIPDQPLDWADYRFDFAIAIVVAPGGW
jgi:predicted transposase YdaD